MTMVAAIQAARTAGQERLENKVRVAVYDYFQKAIELFPQALLGERTMPRISFDLRGQTAGQAGYLAWKLWFNKVLLAENEDTFCRQTVGHEVAHLVAHELLVRAHRPSERSHGATWARVMRAFGLVPERCHHYDVTNAQVRKVERHPYHCACRTFELSSVRHNKVRKGTAQYKCRCCNQVLVAGKKGD